MRPCRSNRGIARVPRPRNSDTPAPEATAPMAINPIAYTERVVGDFLRYQLSTYPATDS